jgi:hypothetical protein
MRGLKYPVVALVAACIAVSPLHATPESPTPTTVTPEPATYALMAAGLAGVAIIARRRKNKND